MNIKFKLIVPTACLILSVSAYAFAGDVTIPNQFSAGSPAVAAEVNDNFSAVKTAVDDNNSKIDTHINNADIHQEKYTDAEAVTAVLNADGPGSGLDADTLDGHTSSDFITAGGDTMSGALTVPKINYSSPRTHYFTVGSEAFVPTTNVDYTNGSGTGGAFRHSGTGNLMAPVHLPQGAVVTEFTVYYYDNSSQDMSVTLFLQRLTGNSYATMARVETSDTPGYDNDTTTTIANETIDNTDKSYLVSAYCNSWDGSNLKVKGAVISYTISEAP